jgi:hypothetical protein
LPFGKPVIIEALFVLQQKQIADSRVPAFILPVLEMLPEVDIPPTISPALQFRL